MATAPIVIFAFNRPDALQRLGDALRKCALFDESKIIVFVDGPRNEPERAKVQAAIEVARSLTDDVRASASNRGLGPSIIAGVTDVINEYGRVIVLEDDLVPAPGMLMYLNQMLDRYADEPKVCSVCAYGLKIRRPEGYSGDVYFSPRSSSWGWATWRDRWEKIDWAVSDYESFRHNRRDRRSFNRGGSDMASMLDGYMAGRNRSWAIRFCYWQWRNGLLSVHPFRSLVDNEGFGAEATNCRQSYSRFRIDLDLLDYQLVTPPPTTHPICLWKVPRGLSATPESDKQQPRSHCFGLRIYSKLRKFFRF